ncbi:MAG: hypothetical protein ACLP2Y_00395 [Limisphaerales bacterium]
MSHKPFVGSVELIPFPPKFIEFIDAHRLWGFPIEQLAHFVLDENPEHHGKRTLPPHQLILVYPDAVVILRGWRLELLVGPLVAGRIVRIHAEKHLGTLIIEEAWVSEIHVIPYDDPRLPEGRLEIPIPTKKKK